MTAEVIPLAQLTLDEHADKIRALGKRVIADVIEIGQRLIECKRICGHGNWLPWLGREFGWTEMTATRFMNCYEMSKSNKLLDLDLPISGLYLLAAPSTPTKARNEVITRAESGEKMSHATVEAIIHEHKTIDPESTAGKTKKAKKTTPYKIKVPDGYSNLSSAIRDAVKEERSGIPLDEIVQKFKLSPRTYKVGRDIVLLASLPGLSAKETASVQHALDDLDENKRIQYAEEKIKPIVKKVWGIKGNRFKSDKKRSEAFINSISFVVTGCNAIRSVEIPHLEETRRNELSKDLEEAIESLQQLCKRLNK